MARKTKNDAKTTRNNILDAAARVLLRRGVARTSLIDIAREAGVTRGAIYWHFANKDDLLRTLWEGLLKEDDFFFQTLDVKDESDPLGFLVEQLFVFLKKLPANARRQRLFRLFLNESDMSSLGDLFPFDRKVFQLKRVHTIEALLSDAIEKKQLPPGIDASLGAIAIISYVDGLAPQYQLLVDELEMHIETPFLINGLMHMLRFGCIRQSC
ncbi:TetR family transcriptional regulator [Desulfobulbus sp.]|uniref:TetR family transcriptional regulator n=1 Tax=Desulfobulbus sp. TaxID=895 RepID=UPI0027BA2627|nr:TetR family transcriptional regulator [Desulfobulbus sp.]